MTIKDDNPVYFVSGADLDAVGEKIGLARIVECDADFRQRIYDAMLKQYKDVGQERG